VTVEVEILQSDRALRLGYAVFDLEGNLLGAGPLASPREIIYTRQVSGRDQVLIIRPLERFDDLREVRFTLEVY
jgi:hypothetical protein